MTCNNCVEKDKIIERLKEERDSLKGVVRVWSSLKYDLIKVFLKDLEELRKKLKNKYCNKNIGHYYCITYVEKQGDKRCIPCDSVSVCKSCQYLNKEFQKIKGSLK